MSLNAIHENEILAKISEFTVVSFSNHPQYSSEEISFNQTFKSLKATEYACVPSKLLFT